jgi:hypothetical protein
MRFLDGFRRDTEKSLNQPERIARGAPFVMTLEGRSIQTRAHV